MVTWLQDLSARVTALNEIVSGIVASIDNASTNIQSKLDGVIQAVQANASSPVPGGAGGGFVRGPGTTTSDSILARLSRHEFVIKAAAVAKYGVSTFHALNNLRLPGFATGGPVTGSSTATGPISISDSFFGTQGIKTVTDAIDKSAETISGAIRNVISKLDSILATIGRTNDNTKVINDSINSGLQSIINAISGLSRQVSQQQAAAPQGSAGGGAVATDRGGVPVTTAQGPVTISQDGVISAIQDLKTAISSAFSAISTTLASIGQNIARMAGATPQAGTTGTPAAAPATPAAPGATGTPATSTDIQAITTVLNTISTTLSGDSAKLDTLNTSLTTEASSLGTGFQSIVTAIGSVVTAVQATTAAVQNISTAVDSAASRITDAISTASSGSGGSATELASGGPAGFIRGPGTKTSDSILARLSRGEFVHRAAAVDYYGLPFFHDINNLKFPKFNFGGQVRNISTIFNNATTNSLSTNLQVLDNLKKLPEFSMGGFVTDFGVMTRNSIPQLASGGPVDFGGDSGGNTGRALFLSIDGGKPHGPFTGQGKAVDHVEKEAVKHSISRIAKKPSWYTS
jgi:uncharacterized protein YoxC